MGLFSAIGGFLGSVVEFVDKGISSIIEFGDKTLSSIGDLISGKMLEQPDFPVPPDQGFQVQKSFSPDSSLPIPYGSPKLSGVAVLKEMSPDNKYLHVFFAVSVPLINIDEIFVTGANGNDSEWVYRPATDSYNPATRFSNNIIFKASDAAGGFGAFPADKGCTTYDQAVDLFSGMTAVYVRYEYNRDIYRGEPRLHYSTSPKLPEYSNPVLARKNYMTSSDYGLGVNAALIGSSFATAAALCDEIVNNPDGTTRKRYTFSGVLNSKKPMRENLALFDRAMDADVYKINGVYEIALRGQGDAVITFDKTNIKGEIKLATAESKSRINKFVVNFTDANGNGKTSSAQFTSDDIEYPYAGYPQDIRIERDNGLIKEKRITLEGVTSFYEAQAYAEKALRKSIWGKGIQVTTNLTTDIAEKGSIVGVTLEEFGFANKEFRVESKEIEIQRGRITWKLSEHQDSIYDITYDNQESSAGTITIPNEFARLPAVTNALLGTHDISFTELGNVTTNHYVAKAVNVANPDEVYRFDRLSSPIYLAIPSVGDFNITIIAVSDNGINGIETAPLIFGSIGQGSDWTTVTDLSATKPENNATRGADLALNVANAHAGNIAETATRRWAGETGADKTATALANTNTATGILNTEKLRAGGANSSLELSCTQSGVPNWPTDMGGAALVAVDIGGGVSELYFNTDGTATGWVKLA